jgi:hypothetical protein
VGTGASCCSRIAARRSGERIEETIDSSSGLVNEWLELDREEDAEGRYEKERMIWGVAWESRARHQWKTQRETSMKREGAGQAKVAM